MDITYSRPVTAIIRDRFSCRTYSGARLPDDARTRLAEAAEAMRAGPFGASLRFRLMAATPEDGGALKGLGTYGTIRGASAFLLGAATRGTPREGVPATAAARSAVGVGGSSVDMYLEDFGFALEQLILLATDLGLGSCWLGGFFSRGAFSRRIGLAEDERIPAVASVGLIPDPGKARRGAMRVAVGGSRRVPWEELFFDAGGAPLSREAAGAYELPLEMVRLAPSASNKQPWRVVRDGRAWHFFLKRTPGYPGRLGKGLIGIEDVQRVDIGIAMCHFELAAREGGARGSLMARQPAPSHGSLAYVASWEER